MTAETTYREYKTKAILKKKCHTDSWFLCSNGGSPYRGCEHACVYCDGRSERYGLPKFDSEIQVKINAPEALEKDLSRFFPKQKTLLDLEDKPTTWVFYGGSGTSDWYQPAERKYLLVRRMIEKYVKYEIPLHIMTKSDLVLRDMELLKRLPWCAVSFSFSTPDARLANIFEPKATTPHRRLEAMKRISEEGLVTGACYMPIIPYITDSQEMIDEMILGLKKAGGSYVLPGCMTLRRDKEESFFSFLKRHFPDVLSLFKKLYIKGYVPKGEYMRELNGRVLASCSRNGIRPYMPRYIPKIPKKKNLEVGTMLHRISMLYELRNGSSQKSNAFRFAAYRIENMKEEVAQVVKDGRLHEIKGVGRVIGSAIEEFLEEGTSSLLKRLES